MISTRIRLFSLWALVAILISACAAKGETPSQQTINALIIVGISGISIVFIVAFSIWVANRQWSPLYKGGSIGFLLGLILAAVVIRRIPIETQMVVIGAILGIGSDFLATVRTPEGPKTSIDWLSKTIVNTAQGVLGAVETSGINPPDYKIVTSSLWSMILTVGFTLIIGNLF